MIKIIRSSSLYNYEEYFKEMQKDGYYIKGNLGSFILFKKQKMNRQSKVVYKNSFVKVLSTKDYLKIEHKENVHTLNLLINSLILASLFVIQFKGFPYFIPIVPNSFEYILRTVIYFKIIVYLYDCLMIINRIKNGRERIPITYKTMVVSIFDLILNITIFLAFVYYYISFSKINESIVSSGVFIYISGLTTYVIASFILYYKYFKTIKQKIIFYIVFFVLLVFLESILSSFIVSEMIKNVLYISSQCIL